jgi:hypothetical protein
MTVLKVQNRKKNIMTQVSAQDRLGNRPDGKKIFQNIENIFSVVV